MGVDVSPIGMYSHWSPLADYTSEKLAQISDTLPVPNGKVYTLPQDHFKKYGNVIDITFGIDNELKTYITNYYIACEQHNKENELQTLSDILNYLEKRNDFVIDNSIAQSRYLGRLLRNLNRHNTYKVPEGAIKNIIQSKIVQVSLDERNMKPGYSPIDEALDQFKSLIKDIKTPGSDTRSLDDGLSKYRLQYANSVGKQDVGVMANGLKMFLALTQYFNRFRKQDAQNAMSDSTRRFLIRLNLKTGEKYFGKLSDIQFEKEAIRAFSAYASLISGKVIEVENRMDDATQLLSGLISLAVDNAKELALDRLNAALDLACMHLYLVSLGCTADEIVDAVTKNPAFAALAKDLQNQSKLIPSRKVLSTWFNPTSRERENGWNKDQIEGYDQLKFLYHAAQEFTAGARLLGINQGVLNDEFEIERKYDNFASLIANQVENLGLGIEQSMNPYSFKLADPMQAVIRAKTNLNSFNPEYLQYTQQKWDALIKENVENQYLKSDLKVDLNRYYKDSTYKDFIIRFYDFFKTTYNLYEMIDSLPHYNKMLEAFVNAENIIIKSNRANWLMKQSRDAYNEHHITNSKLKTFGDSEYSYREEVFQLKPFGDSTQKKANRFYDMQILKTFLSENHENYRFAYKDSNGEVQVIDPKNNENLKKLADFVAFNLIPDLKDLYPQNKFLQFLRPDYKKASKSKDAEIYLPKYMFNFDVDKLHSVSDENKLYYINSGFNEIGNLTLNDIYEDMIEGGDLKIADLIMLNDRITSMSSYGQTSLDKAFNLYSQENKNTIPVQIAKIIQELDLGIRPALKLDSVEFLAFCYQNQIRRNFDGVMQYDYDWESKTYKEYSIRNQYLIGFDENTILHNKEVRDAENLIKLLQAEKFTVEIRPYLEGYGQFLMFDTNPLIKIKTGSSVEEVSDISFEDLLDVIKNNSQFDPIFQSNFRDAMNQALSEIEAPQLQSFETLNAYKKMVQRMNLLGIPVMITDGVENGKVENGVIYLNPNSDVTTTPIHELMHLVFAVMKSDNYKDFEKLIKLLQKNEDFMEIFHQIDASPEYSDYMENDKMEEALCRLIETIASDQYDISNLVDDYGEELESKLSKYINPYIGKTFGTPEPNSFITFLSSMISELPAYNSSIFAKPKKDTTGYMQQRIKVIQQAKITNWIKDNLVNKLLLEVEC